MTAWLELPFAVRLTILALVGAASGGLVNWAIATCAYFRLPFSPWSRVDASYPRRAWATRLPIFGWWLRGGEAETLHRLNVARLTKMGYEVPDSWRPRLPFWTRPMLIELSLTFGLPALYAFETTGGLLPPALQSPGIVAAQAGWLHVLFISHAVLLVLMLVATFIDFDEQLIPDTITIPGTLFALGLSSVTLQAVLPVGVFANGNVRILPCIASAPESLGAWWFEGTGLAVGALLWSGWCFALSNRRVILRRGPAKAVTYFFARLARDQATKGLLAMWAIGIVGVTAVWLRGGDPWTGLVTSLVGLAVGGGVIWAVRLVASAAMGEEAMGFGDVTLMAMIGAFLGWQATSIAFFIAPFTAIVIVLVQFVATGQRATPFGPYLCAGSAVCVVYWPTLWQQAVLPALVLGRVFFAIMLGSLIAMGVLLFVWSGIKRRLLNERHEPG